MKGSGKSVEQNPVGAGFSFREGEAPAELLGQAWQAPRPPEIRERGGMVRRSRAFGKPFRRPMPSSALLSFDP
jgi:hypothetical protein